MGSGNVVTTPVALPVEGFGLAGSAVGNATGYGDEIKKIHSGNGDTNTNDDGSTLSSNVGGVAIAAPVQLFGDAAAVIANARGTGWNDTTATAGRNTQARGTTGTGSGNIGYVPVSLPTQVFGDAGAVFGNGDATAFNVTHSKAGAPVKLVAMIYNVPIEVIGRAMAKGRERGEAMGQHQSHYLDVPTVGEGLGAADIP